jgi:hypothetical protein
MAPACYGSAVLFHASAQECVACPLLRSCARVVKRREVYALDYVARLDKRFKTDKRATVDKWFLSRWKIGANKEMTQQENAKRQLAELNNAGINIYMLKSKVNPAQGSGDCLEAAFAFMLKERVFKPRDIVEYIRDTDPSMSKSALSSVINQLCQTLLMEGVVKKEAKGVLCL